MRSPLTLLALLLAFAVAAGGLLWGLNQRTAAQRNAAAQARKESAATSPASAQAAEIADLRRDLGEYAARNRELEAENAALQQRLEALEAAQKYSPEALAATVEAIRQLSFQQELRFETAPRAEVEEAIARSVTQSYEEGALEQKERALTALGFLFDGGTGSLAEALVGLASNQRVAVYDADSATLTYRDDLDLASPTDRGNLVQEIARALTTQNFGTPGTASPAEDADAALAADALVTGDATQVKLRFTLSDDAGAGGAPPPSPESQERYYGAPAYLRERSLFPYFQGAKFVEALQQADGWEAVDAAYRRPPGSSAEVIHPPDYLGETDYPDDPPAAPERPELPVVWSDTAGEFGIGALLGMQLDPQVADAAADGWRADRYSVFARDDVSPDALPFAWETRWESPEDAQEFYQAIRQFFLRRFQIDYEDESTPTPAFEVEDGGRTLRGRISDDGLGVSVQVGL